MPLQFSSDSTIGQADLDVTAGRRIVTGSFSCRWLLNYEFETHRVQGSSVDEISKLSPYFAPDIQAAACSFAGRLTSVCGKKFCQTTQ